MEEITKTQRWKVGDIFLQRWLSTWYQGSVLELRGHDMRILTHGYPPHYDKWINVKTSSSILPQKIILSTENETDKTTGCFATIGEQVYVCLIDAPPPLTDDTSYTCPSIGTILAIYPKRDASKVKIFMTDNTTRNVVLAHCLLQRIIRRSSKKERMESNMQHE